MLSLRVIGAEKIDQQFTAAREWAASPFGGDAALRIRQDFTFETTKSFASKGASTGKPWKPLSKQYAAWKAEHFPGRPLMIRTGRLSRSITDSKDRNFVFNREGGKRIIMWSRLEHAAYHQKGTKRLPARPLFVMSKEIGQRWAEILNEELSREWIKGGARRN